MSKEMNSSRSQSISWSHGWCWEQVAGLLLGHLESANSPSGLLSPAARFSLLEHPHISAKLFSASPLEKKKLLVKQQCLLLLSWSRQDL